MKTFSIRLFFILGIVIYMLHACSKAKDEFVPNPNPQDTSLKGFKCTINGQTMTEPNATSLLIIDSVLNYTNLYIRGTSSTESITLAISDSVVRNYFQPRNYPLDIFNFPFTTFNYSLLTDTNPMDACYQGNLEILTFDSVNHRITGDFAFETVYHTDTIRVEGGRFNTPYSIQ